MSENRKLGSDSEITRRDFLDGVAVTITEAAIASAAVSSLSLSASEAAAAIAVPDNYPPMRMGLRGFDPAAIEAGHSVRDGKIAGQGVDTGESYDLIVVGSGMSGLAAAYYYRKQLPDSKVLVLEGCDDFGGHARRDEFNVDGHQLLMNGGTFGIWYPNTWPTEGKDLLKDIGVDAERWYKAADAEPNPIRDLGLRPAMYFDKETFGFDQLAIGLPSGGGPTAAAGAPVQMSWSEFVSKTRLSENAKTGLVKLYEGKEDYLAGVSVEEKVRRLKKISYLDYLTTIAKIHPDAVAFTRYQGGGGSSNQAAGPDSFSAWYAYRRGNPGFAGLGLPPASNVSNVTKDAGRHVFFPDGNAGVARLLVRWLVPGSLPGNTMEDSVAPHVNYAVLDQPDNAVRIRLSSMVVRAKHLGDPASAKDVEVSYLRDGKIYRVRGSAVVMACFNAIVPYLCPEMPEDQKAALHMAVRKPLVTTAVAVRNWRAFQKLGVSNISCPGMFFTSIGLNQKVSLGDFKSPRGPDEPIIISMNLTNKILEKPGMAPRDQWRAARAELLAIPFETFEKNIRAQLTRVLGPGGFDAKRDIAGIIINRWGHGYATGSNELYDPDYTHRTDAPWVVGRKRFGRITIANSDAAAVSLTQAAFQQSNRAVNEVITDIVRPVYDFHFSERDTAGEISDNPNNYNY